LPGSIATSRIAPDTGTVPAFGRLVDQAALAIDRVNLAQDIDRARLAAETDRLRAALLTSISHDLRTPLASILGSASSLVTHGHEFDPTVQASLMRTILEEAERLNRFIGNLLDMTRLESGPLKPHSGAADLSDIIGATLQRRIRSWKTTRSKSISKAVCHCSISTWC